MHQKISKTKKVVILLLVMQAVLLCFVYMTVNKSILTAGAIFLAECIAMIYLFSEFDNISEEQSQGVRAVLGSAAEEAYLAGGVGMVIYNEDYIITWMSDLFQKRGIDRVGKKLLTWLPEADDLISGRTDSVTVTLDAEIYEIIRKADAPILIFRDVTEEKTLEKRYEKERFVLGMASFDNYEESTQYADEAETAAISNGVRTPLTQYCHDNGILTKRLNNYKYLLLLDEDKFEKIAADHFSVLNKVRKAAQKMDVSITLSMAFARGAEDFEQLDEMASKLMDLASTRGGDQVAVQTAGEDPKFFGGNTEAAEKRSRVRVRVMSHSFRDLVNNSSNVIICGHKTADFDCIGSAICLAQMVKSLHKQVCIIAKTGGIEEKLKAAMDENAEELKNEISFVTESEAMNQLQPSTLVIMTDHHNIKQSNGSKVLEAAKKIMVIDHHRRATDMGVKPVLVYIEAGASSTCELLTEMISYVSQHVDISELDATMMLTGMIVDTNRWRVRTGARTYEAASALRQLGADPVKANAWLKDTYDEFALKSLIMNNAERYTSGIVISCVKDRYVTRSIMSQVADSLLGIQNVEAAFVIGNTSDSETAVSARSAGKINVQAIMENMHGGGHRTAAALQRPRMKIEDLKEELLENIDIYFNEEGDVTEDESDS